MPVTKERPKGQAVLRQLTQPLYDTNELDADANTDNMLFFVRPQGDTLPVSGGIKSEADTNMESGGNLGDPLEFDLMGFKFEFFLLEPDNIEDNDNDLIDMYQQSVFYFRMNNRKFLGVPLSRIPSGCMLTGVGATGDTTNDIEWGYLHHGLPSVKEIYNFTVGGMATKINSKEPFYCEIDWPNGVIQPTTGTDQRVRVYMYGVLHQSL